MQFQSLKADVVRVKFLRGVTYKDIAKELNVSYDYLRRFMNPGNHKNAETQPLAEKLQAWVARNQ